jgi:hypothetical protein
MIACMLVGHEVAQAQGGWDSEVLVIGCELVVDVSKLAHDPILSLNRIRVRKIGVGSRVDRTFICSGEASGES